MAHGLSCSAACGIFPDQGSNPCPLQWQILNHCTTKEARWCIFNTDQGQRKVPWILGCKEASEEGLWAAALSRPPAERPSSHWPVQVAGGAPVLWFPAVLRTNTRLSREGSPGCSPGWCECVNTSTAAFFKLMVEEMCEPVPAQHGYKGEPCNSLIKQAQFITIVHHNGGNLGCPGQACTMATSHAHPPALSVWCQAGVATPTHD